MEIKDLQQTPFSAIVECIKESFSDYFVPVPSDISYFENRFQAARVDYRLSFGMFREEKLVGFILNGIDELNGKKTAYNTATGVAPSARGNKVIDQLYTHALPIFKENGITQCTLEVIKANEKATHVYSRIGFSIRRDLLCFVGTLQQQNSKIISRKAPFSSMSEVAQQFDHFYSWDFTTKAINIRGDQFQYYEVLDDDDDDDADQRPFGYFILNPAGGLLVQIETWPGREDRFRDLLSGIANVIPSVKINNVDSKRTAMIAGLKAAGLENPADLYEMQMDI